MAHDSSTEPKARCAAHHAVSADLTLCRGSWVRTSSTAVTAARVGSVTRATACASVRRTRKSWFGGEPKQELPVPLGLAQAQQHARLSDNGLLVSREKIGVDHSPDFVGESGETEAAKWTSCGSLLRRRLTAWSRTHSCASVVAADA